MKALETRPHLSPYTSFVWRLFSELHKGRQIGMEPSGLAVSEIKTILDLYLVDDAEERLSIYNMIQRLDKRVLELYQVKQKSKPKNANP